MNPSKPTNTMIPDTNKRMDIILSYMAKVPDDPYDAMRWLKNDLITPLISRYDESYQCVLDMTEDDYETFTYDLPWVIEDIKYFPDTTLLNSFSFVHFTSWNFV